MSASPYHHFTVDVEEYFQVSALESAIPRETWPNLESRVEGSVRLLLDLLEGRGVLGTFFVLGLVADRHPQLVREVHARGHEVASHGWGHRRVTTLDPGRFRESVRRTRELLEELTGERIRGYRAPSFSITRGYEWALEILLEEGYHYDSSLFPTRRPGYGHPDAPHHPKWITTPSGRILEVPPSILRIGGLRIPAGGGAYFRLLPYALVQAAMRQAERNGHPGTFYLHPWELDPEQPRVAVPFHTRVRHYGGLDRTQSRLERLLTEFRFAPVQKTFSRFSPAGSI